MNRNILLVGAVVVLILTAGCTGMLNETETTPGEDTTTDEATTTGAPEEIDYPDGYDESGVTDWSAALQAHMSGLAGSDSYTYEMTQETTQDDVSQPNQTETQRFDETYRVDVTGETLWYEQEQVSGPTDDLNEPDSRTHREGFQDGSQLYLRVTSLGQTNYQLEESEFNATQHLRPTLVEMTLKSMDFEMVEVTEEDGLTLITYEATSVTNESELVPEGMDATPKNPQSTIEVDTEGRIHKLNLAVTIDSEAEEQPDVYANMSFEISKFDTTDVTEPEWTDKAEKDT